MAKIKMDGIVEHLQVQLQGAMRDVIKEMKLANVTDKDLYVSFKKAVNARCGAWEQVPDSFVDEGY